MSEHIDDAVVSGKQRLSVSRECSSIYDNAVTGSLFLVSLSSETKQVGIDYNTLRLM